MAYVIDGASYPSVTTILNVLDKPALKFWAANCAVDYINENLEEFMSAKAPHTITNILTDARTAFKTASKEACDIGTQVHKAIENYIKHGKDLSGDLPEQVQHGFLAFLEWEEKNKAEWLDSELELFDSENGYAGTCDVILKMNGNVYLVDFKTSKAVYDEYKTQIAAYLQAYNSKAENKIQYTGILRLDKETGEPEFVDTSFRMDDRIRSFNKLVDYYYADKKRRLKNNPFVKKYWG